MLSHPPSNGETHRPCAIARSQLAKLASVTTLAAMFSIMRTPSFGSGRRFTPFSRRKVKQATNGQDLLMPKIHLWGRKVRTSIHISATSPAEPAFG